MKTIDEFKSEMRSHIDAAQELIDAMPHKGDTCSTSQKMCLQQALNELEYAVNGTEQSDLKEDEDEDD